MKILISSCAFVCALAVVWESAAGETVVVKTQRYGSLRGTRTTVGQQVVDTFLGIPYAAPPTGNLRFRQPIRPQPWTGIRDATRFGPSCPQRAIEVEDRSVPIGSVSEDCLYLNVYAPKTTANLPVMVFIHGGAYYLGSGSLYNGTYLASKQILVVTINYRLDALGFLSTEDEASVGNYGLWDQLLALRWVQEVISDFGGDMNLVTIAGQSAGGFSVSELLMTEESVSLFVRAIMESGTSLSPMAMGYAHFRPSPRELATSLATRVGCPSSSDSAAMMDCLRTKEAMAIINASIDITPNTSSNILFRPVVESTFGQKGLFRATPKATIEGRGFYNIPTMRGFTHDELCGIATSPDPDDRGVTLAEFKTRVMATLSDYYRQSSDQELQRMLTIILDAYVVQPNITDLLQLRTVLCRCLSDFFFAAGTVLEVDLTTRQRDILPQYLYRFSYRPPNTLVPRWQGVRHGTDLSFVFGYPYYDDPLSKFSVANWTDEDRRMADQVMTMWTSFVTWGTENEHKSVKRHAKTTILDISLNVYNSNPTPDGQWQPWTTKDRYFMEINSTSILKSFPLSPQDAWDTILNLPDNPGTPDMVVG